MRSWEGIRGKRTVKFATKICVSTAALALVAHIEHAAADTILSSGTFHGGPHAPADTTSGSVRLLHLGNGRYELHLGTNFKTTRGPDLFIYISAADDPKDDKTIAESAFVNAGKLSSPIGSQSFLLPAGFDPGPFKSVAVWCRQFAVLFGAAVLVSR